MKSMHPLLFALLLASTAPFAATAGIYRFVDADGVVHFSDTPHDARYHVLRARREEGLAITPPSGPAKAPIHHEFDGLIFRLARAHGVEPALVKAVVAAESNFEASAVSRVGAQGLMQLMPATAVSLGVDAPFEAGQNLSGGVRYLRRMLDRYGDVTRALAAYNAGPTAVDRYRGIPPYKETQAYVKRVLNYYRAYQGQFPID